MECVFCWCLLSLLVWDNSALLPAAWTNNWAPSDRFGSGDAELCCLLLFSPPQPPSFHRRRGLVCSEKLRLNRVIEKSSKSGMDLPDDVTDWCPGAARCCLGAGAKDNKYINKFINKRAPNWHIYPWHMLVWHLNPSFLPRKVIHLDKKIN